EPAVDAELRRLPGLQVQVRAALLLEGLEELVDDRHGGLRGPQDTRSADDQATMRWRKLVPVPLGRPKFSASVAPRSAKVSSVPRSAAFTGGPPASSGTYSRVWSVPR